MNMKWLKNIKNSSKYLKAFEIINYFHEFRYKDKINIKNLTIEQSLDYAKNLIEQVKKNKIHFPDIKLKILIKQFENFEE